MNKFFMKFVNLIKNIFHKNSLMLDSKSSVENSYSELVTCNLEYEALLIEKDNKLKELENIKRKELEITLDIYRLEEKYLLSLKVAKEAELKLVS